MNSEPLFSVLVANYNNGEYLQECLDSIFAQTYKNWEIILVDDGSTDISHEIYKKFKFDKRINIILNERNEGCGFTKRKCAELANGELCAFVDPDDKIDTTALEVMTLEHLKNPKCSIVYSNYFKCDDNLHVIEEVRPPGRRSFGIAFDDTIEGISHLVSYKNYMYKRTEGISADLKRAADKDLYYKLEEQGDLHYISLPLYYYRVHAEGISTNRNVVKAEYWSWVGKIRMAERRGIDLEDFFELRMSKKIEFGKRQMLKTHNYRFGKFVLDPLRRINQIFKIKLSKRH